MKERLSIKGQLHENITCAPVPQVCDESHMAYDTPMQCEKGFFMKKYFSVKSEYNKRIDTRVLCERPRARPAYDVDHIGEVLCCLTLDG
jgi:hypothetical protein